MPDFFVHKNAICESEAVGKGTRIWAFSHIMKNAVIGEDCNFGNGSFVESGVKIGDRVTVKNGVSIWDGVEIEDDVFLGPNCVMTNDLFPRSKVYHPENIKTLIRQGASIGANSTIVCGITLGKYCMIGAGSVVTKDVPDFTLVIGVPAKYYAYVGKDGNKLIFDNESIAKDSFGNIYKLENDKVLLREEK